ncbi:MAG: PQQ-dependent sugar dehydrogenase [Panacagrimonas sp.]
MRSRWQGRVLAVAIVSGLAGLAGGKLSNPLAPVSAQTEPPFGLNARVPLSGVNLPFDGEPSSGGARVVRAFPNLRFSNPLYLAAAPGSDAHLFVVERDGVVRRFANAPGTATAEVFLDIRARVKQGGFEEGLLGLAFHPQYASNGFFYVYYSPASGVRRTVLSRFRRSSVNPGIGDAASEQILLSIPQPFDTHKAGCMQFGPDGKLYLSSGDGGSAGDPNDNGQNLGTLLGKLLRINDDGSIPADNPFVGVPGARGEIWAYGLRNPWRFSMDASTGRIWLGDVGQDEREEVNLIRRGGNYGWRIFEGNVPFMNPAGRPLSDFDAPTFSYPHSSSNPQDVTGFSITGGYVYRGGAIPALAGKYLFADFVAGRVWALGQNDGVVTGVTSVGDVSQPASFGSDNAGNLYIVGLDGPIYSLVADGGSPMSPVPPKLSQTGLFSDTAGLRPNPGLIEYEINAPFWSDGTLKRRWIGLDGASKIGFTASGAWTWSSRAVVVKHFEIVLAGSARKRLETRVLVNTSQGWRGYTYVWNDAQTDADLLPDARRSVELDVADPSAPGGARRQTYVFPSRSDCLVCHTQVAGVILGARTAQTHRDFPYPNGVRDNQLRAFNHIGLFDRNIGSATQYAAMTDPSIAAASLDRRARAYLDTNCAQCHQPGGPTSVGLDLRASVDRADMRAVGVRPSAGALGIAEAFIVAPSHKERSVLWERIRRLDGARMPPLGSHRVDTEGVALIGQWIDSLGTPAISFVGTTRDLSESAGSVFVSVRLSAAASLPVSMPIQFAGSGRRPDDYQVSTTTIRIPSGSTRAALRLQVVDDAIDEASEKIVLTLGAPVNATLDGPSRQTLTLADNDAPPSVSFSTSRQSVEESGRTVTVRIKLSTVSAKTVRVPVSFGGTARRPDDFSVAIATVVIAPGATGASLVLRIVDDAVRGEGNETAIATLGTPTNATLGSRTRHTVAIVDND